jgi:hypothetical protein
LTNRRAAALAVSVAALAVATSGCSGTPQAPKEIPPAPSPPNGANRGKIGDSIRLAGSNSQMRVRVVDLLDPLPVGPADATLNPSARFVGVEIALRNVGQTNYAESPLADAMLVGGAKAPGGPPRKILGEPVLGGPCSRPFARHVKVAPGAERSGCLAFEVPAGKPPSVFQFALDSGFGDEVGMWTLK